MIYTVGIGTEEGELVDFADGREVFSSGACKKT